MEIMQKKLKINYENPEHGYLWKSSVQFCIWMIFTFKLQYMNRLKFIYYMNNYPCITRNRKNSFIVFPKITVQKRPSLIRNSVTHSKVWLEGMRPSWDCQLYPVDHPYPSPPHHMDDYLTCQESYIRVY